jgi:2-haloacid dehalogenase
VELKALTFDIIGTVFDAYDSLAGGVAPLNAKYGVSVNGAAFAEGSLLGYSEGVGKVRSGEVWTPPDVILQNATRANLPLQQLGAKAADAVEDYFSLWRALKPWPDVPMGLQSLHTRFRLAILSNMSIPTQSALRFAAKLPFDVLLSAETVKAYKADPAVYRMAITSLNLNPAEILMVAAHNFDLLGAKGLGFRTAFVARPHEDGPYGSPGDHPDPAFDFNAVSLVDLAQQLGAAFVPTPNDCLPIDVQRVRVELVAGHWKIVDDGEFLLDFGGSRANAERGAAILARYRIDRMCFVGRPNPPMTYFTVNGGAPAGAMEGEDSIPFNPSALVAQNKDGWIVTDGESRLLDFGGSEMEALEAIAAIRRFGFTHQCFVGRPDPPMMYFRR